MAQTLSRADLASFTGSSTWYRHPLDPRLLYTDGVRYVAEIGQAYWLLDELALAQRHVPAVAAEPFQVWHLAVKPDRSAMLECSDGNDVVVFRKAISYTDFPLVCIRFYLTNSTILLPQEY